MRAAAATGLAAAAVKARCMAEEEEREVARLVAAAVERQLQLLRTKLARFSALEEALACERSALAVCDLPSDFTVLLWSVGHGFWRGARCRCFASLKHSVVEEIMIGRADTAVLSVC